MVAVAAGHSDIVKMLLDVTADPNTANGDGFTPLIMASTKGFAGTANGHQSLLCLLLSKTRHLGFCPSNI